MSELKISKVTKEKIIEALNDTIPLIELDVLENHKDINVIGFDAVFDNGVYNYELYLCVEGKCFSIKL